MRKHLLVLMSILTVFTVANAQQYSTLKDLRDGKIYKTVRIGQQEWMAENFDGTRFRNGDVIPQVSTLEAWHKAIKEKRPAWCYSLNGEKGTNKLYNVWTALDPRGIGPKGWRVPTREDIIILNESFIIKVENPAADSARAADIKKQIESGVINSENEYLDIIPEEHELYGNISPGRKLRSTGWGEGTNESGFNAKPFKCLCGSNYSTIWFAYGGGTAWWTQKTGNGSNAYFVLSEKSLTMTTGSDSGGITGVNRCITRYHALSIRLIKE